jgi:type IV pilus assembly protein PilB
MPTKLLGESLVEAGLINNEELSIALTEQQNSKEKLGVILVSMGYVSADTLIGFLAKQPELTASNFVKEAIENSQIPFFLEELSYKFQLLPIGFKKVGEHYRLMVAMSDPSQSELVEQCVFSSGCEVEPVFAQEVSLRQLLQYRPLSQNKEAKEQSP